VTYNRRDVSAWLEVAIAAALRRGRTYAQARTVPHRNTAGAASRRSL